MSLDNDSVEIANAALKAVETPSTHLTIFRQLIETKKPPAECLANAIAYASAQYPGIYCSQIQAILQAQLQVVLTREHVRAQERMLNSSGWLAAASVFLAIVSLIGSCSGITQ